MTHSPESSPINPATAQTNVEGATNPNGSVKQAPGAESPLAAELSSNGQTPAELAADPAPGIARTRIKPLSPAAAPAPGVLIVLLAIAIMLTGLTLNSGWVGISGATVAIVVSLRLLWTPIRTLFLTVMTQEERTLLVAILGIFLSIVCLFRFSDIGQQVSQWYNSLNWDAVGATGEVVGAVGQILIAILAVYVAWRQYVISKDLTIQQNLITQQQTIDAYFQGVSELVLDAEGLLEDWPQERAIAEGRTAAILGSVDAGGKAKIIRFLSRSRLLSPLKRDRLLGRAILDGAGGYQEDRDFGVRVIDLGVMLAGATLAGTDLRWTDMSDANLIRANLNQCDLVKANLARTILYDASLIGADMMGTQFFYGAATTATPRSRTEIPDYATGVHTGAVVENADFTGVQRLSEEQRYYCCAWGGARTRATMPGGCEGIPNRLGR